MLSGKAKLLGLFAALFIGLPMVGCWDPGGSIDDHTSGDSDSSAGTGSGGSTGGGGGTGGGSTGGGGTGGGDTGGGGSGGGNTGTDGDDNTYSNGHPLSTATTDSTILGVEEEVRTLVNNHRVSIGKNALAMHEGMRKTARAHSKHMGPVHAFFDHNNPEGDDPFDRMDKNNITYQTAGENIAAGYANATAAFNGWMGSPGHKANIENSLWTHTGIGYWTGGSYGKYYTQLFAKM